MTPEAATPRANEAIYDTARLAPSFVRELTELLRYRDLVVQLVSRDVRTRYKRSVLGIAWTMLNPLLMMVVLTIVFSQIFRADLPHYPVYLLSAQLLWTFFSQSTTLAMSHLVWGGPLITKIYLPRSVFAISQIGTGFVNFALALVPLALIMLATGVPFTLALLWIPLAMVLVAMFALGVALLLSTLAVGFPDVVEMYQIALAAWYFLTPILYPVTILPEAERQWLALNPVYYLVEAFRAPVYAGTAPDPATLLIAFACAIGALVLGWFVFTAKADEIPVRL